MTFRNSRISQGQRFCVFSLSPHGSEPGCAKKKYGHREKISVSRKFVSPVKLRSRATRPSPDNARLMRLGRLLDCALLGVVFSRGNRRLPARRNQDLI
jgi:hypothetical protein